MRYACLSPLLLCAGFVLGVCVTTAAAAESSDGSSEGAVAERGAPAADSPWEHELWHDATTLMRLYVCGHARRPPSWCEAQREPPAKAELPTPQGPPLAEEDARWLAFMDQADPANFSPDDVATLRRRAVERRDPQAMEILAYLHAEGLSVARDYAEAYRWYALAYLAGERRVRANMDVVWRQLQRHDLEAAQALNREFNSLGEGELPAALLPPAAEAAGQSPAQETVAPQ